MATPESRIKGKITPCLTRRKDQGLWYFMPVPSGYGRTTIDYLCCYRSHFFGIEAKAPGEVPTARQDGELADISAAGGTTFVIDSIDGVLRLEAWLTILDRLGEPGELGVPPCS